MALQQGPDEAAAHLERGAGVARALGLVPLEARITAAQAALGVSI